jgi:hypothetical protein
MGSRDGVLLVNLPFRARLLLWDFDRGTLAYDLLGVLILLLLFLIPPGWLADPMAVWF